MKCPACESRLSKSRYEGLVVNLCENCEGYLVETRRARQIRQRRDTSREDLADEVLKANGLDTADRLRCPRCMSLMQKEKLNANSSFYIDHCRRCELIWFDAGELAKMQLEYEFSEQGMEAERFQERHRNMTEEEKQLFAERLANLPPGDLDASSSFSAGLHGALLGLRRTMYRM